MFRKAELQVKLAGKNHFRPNEMVKGEVVVTAKKNFTLNVLQCTFRGEVVITIKQRIESRGGVASERVPGHTETYCDNHLLINNYVDLGVGSEGVIMNKGDSRSFEFEFVFPEFVICHKCHQSTRLPSTNFSTVGGVENVNCQVSVAYVLTATAEPDSTFGNAQGEISLMFTQTRDENLMLFTHIASSYRNGQVWEGKMKKFVDSNYKDYGKENVATEGVECIRNPLDEAHNHSRSIRKIFNSSYKKENYSKLVGDVGLELELFIKNRVIYASQDVRDCFSLTFRASVPHLQPDYLLYSKKSSQLGLFSIRSATIALIRNYTVTANVMTGTFPQRANLFNKNYGHELSFDIVDFKPNYEDPTLLEWTIPLKEILFSKEIIISSTKATYKPNYLSGCDILGIAHQLSVTLSVANDFEETPRPIEIIYDIQVM
ncbi:hypothetical protein CLIB1423_12S03246 [[Candida] railenensis]|uniref:Uncharacterized protein n=1 Tax=[Candida] railenensis TaxID=45579 RepID=A0A9P0VZR0_9ASCO|nr:hypothetical protein CLIB1423_12S03246 [[Candida] railenensis]